MCHVIRKYFRGWCISETSRGVSMSFPLFIFKNQIFHSNLLMIVYVTILFEGGDSLDLGVMLMVGWGYCAVYIWWFCFLFFTPLIGFGVYNKHRFKLEGLTCLSRMQACLVILTPIWLRPPELNWLKGFGDIGNRGRCSGEIIALRKC